MKIKKQYESIVTLTSIELYMPDIDIVILDKLRKIFEGRCFNQTQEEVLLIFCPPLPDPRINFSCKSFSSSCKDNIFSFNCCHFSAEIILFLFIRLKNCHKRFLWYFHRTNLFHTFFAGLLFL